MIPTYPNTNYQAKTPFNPRFENDCIVQMEEIKQREGAPTGGKLHSLFDTSKTYLIRGVVLGLIIGGYYVSSFLPELDYSHGLNVEL